MAILQRAQLGLTHLCIQVDDVNAEAGRPPSYGATILERARTEVRRGTEGRSSCSVSRCWTAFASSCYNGHPERTDRRVAARRRVGFEVDHMVGSSGATRGFSGHTSQGDEPPRRHMRFHLKIRTGRPRRRGMLDAFQIVINKGPIVDRSVQDHWGDSPLGTSSSGRGDRGAITMVSKVPTVRKHPLDLAKTDPRSTRSCPTPMWGRPPAGRGFPTSR